MLLLDHALEHGSGDAVVALVSLHERLRTSLATVIGDNGVHVLLVRSLAIAGKEHPALRVLAPKAGDHEDWNRTLTVALGKLPRDEIVVHGVALYATFLALLTSFIGRPLTARILQTAWPETAITFEDDA